MAKKYVYTNDGEANFHGIAGPKNWVARVQLNGELTRAEQAEIMSVILDALNNAVVSTLPCGDLPGDCCAAGPACDSCGNAIRGPAIDPYSEKGE